MALDDSQFPYKLGLRYQPPPPRTPRLEDHLGALPGLIVPPACHWAARVPHWGPMGNDRYSDCVEAAMGHCIQVWTHNAHPYFCPTDEMVLGAYRLISGFVPGVNDPGTYMLQALNWWKYDPQGGIAGHKIDMYAIVANFKDEATVHAAIFAFGAILFAFSLPDSIGRQFRAHKTFDVDGEPDEINGHCIACSGYAPGFVWGNTWGHQQKMTWAFIEKYAYAAYVPMSPHWMTRNGLSVSGLNRAALMQEIVQLG